MTNRQHYKEGDIVLTTAVFSEYAGGNSAWVEIEGDVNISPLNKIKAIPTIPDFVAGGINYAKRQGYSLSKAISFPFNTELTEWLENKDNQDTFARAWLDGYKDSNGLNLN